MHWAKLVLPLFVLSVTGAGIAALVLSPSPQTETSVVSAKPPKPTAPKKPVEENIARDVGGGAVAIPDLPNTALERIAPLRPQRREFFGPPIPVKPKPELVLMFQPVIENAGTIAVEGRTIRLMDVFPIEADVLCTDANGNEWPCGKAARTAFRSMVRGRAISCRLPDQQKVDVEAECSIGKENLGQWLVEQGWAEAAPGSDFESLGRAAELMGRGIYGKGG